MELQQFEISREDLDNLFWILSSSPEPVSFTSSSLEPELKPELKTESSDSNPIKKVCGKRKTVQFKIPVEQKKAKPATVQRPLPLSQKYMCFYSSALNTDPVRLGECLKTICSVDCQFGFHVLSVSNFGNFRSLRINFEQLIECVKKIQRLAPDTIMEALDSEEIHPDEDPDETILTSKFTLSGTKICEDSIFMISDEAGNLVSLESVEEKLEKQGLQKFQQKYFLSGTAKFYRNSSGLIYKIDFVYDYQ